MEQRRIVLHHGLIGDSIWIIDSTFVASSPRIDERDAIPSNLKGPGMTEAVVAPSGVKWCTDDAVPPRHIASPFPRVMDKLACVLVLSVI